MINGTFRVRHDKTEEYRNKKSNYGNPYHVANDNSIYMIQLLQIC